MRKLRKKTLFFALIIMAAAISALWYWNYLREAKKEPASNAKFVLINEKRRTAMNEEMRAQLPLCDANGNAGTHAPEREIYYEARGALDQKNAEGQVK